jgi:hypothetical protein
MSGRIKTGASRGYVIVSKRRKNGRLEISSGWNGSQFSPNTANVYSTMKQAKNALHRLLELNYDRCEYRIDIVPAAQW